MIDLINIPTPLYHYTSQSGLLGIIQSKQIWATNLLFLNDSAELTYAIDLVQNKIEKRKNKIPLVDAKILTEFSDSLNIINTPIYQGVAGIYVCSFSEEGDQLSQWRGYCPDGMGFSIGFDFNSPLGSYVEEQDFFLNKCEYEKDEQDTIIQSFLDEILNVFHDFKDDDFVNRFAWQNFRRTAPRLKHPKFKEEREWRLIYLPDEFGYSDVEFRTGKSMVIPYKKIYLSAINNDESTRREPLGWIPEIWVSPTPNPTLSQISLDNLLKVEKVSKTSHDSDVPLHHCKVRSSKIPYRSW